MGGEGDEGSDSDGSILELEKPSKPPPLLIQLDEEDVMLLNIKKVEHTVLTNKSTREKSPLVKKSDNSDEMNPYHWTSDMITFYNEEDLTKEYDFDHIRKNMDGYPNLWTTGSIPLGQRNRRNQPCFNCGNIGHDERKCRPMCCIMCGGDDHYVRMCPRKLCLSCGKKTTNFVNACGPCNSRRTSTCPRCGINGHMYPDCTDHWRRFHHVTTLTKVVPPEEPVHKDSSQLWCCNCARRGHVEAYCMQRKPRDFAPTSTILSSYDRGFVLDKADLSEHDYGEQNNQSNRNNATRGEYHAFGKSKRYFEVTPHTDCLKRKADESVGAPSKIARRNDHFPASTAPEFIPLQSFAANNEVNRQFPIPTNNPGIFILNEKINQDLTNKRMAGNVSLGSSVANESLRKKKNKKKAKPKSVLELTGTPLMVNRKMTTSPMALNGSKESSTGVTTSKKEKKKKNKIKQQQQKNRRKRKLFENMNAPPNAMSLDSPKTSKKNNRSRNNNKTGPKNEMSNKNEQNRRRSAELKGRSPGHSRDRSYGGPSGDRNARYRPNHQKFSYARNMPPHHIENSNTGARRGQPCSRGVIQSWNGFLLG